MYTCTHTHTWSNLSARWSALKGTAAIKIGHSCTVTQSREVTHKTMQGKHMTPHTHSRCHHPDTSWACTVCPITMWQLLLVGLYVLSLLLLYLHPVITPPFSALGQVAFPHAHTSPHLQGTELHPSKACVQGAVRCPPPHLGAWQVCQVSYRHSPQSNLSR